MQHRTDTNSGAKVRGAGGQVAASLAEGVVEVGLQRGVELVDRHPSFVHLQSRQQGLHAQVILLVDHYAQRLVAAEHHAAAGCLGGVLPADEMALDEQLLVQRGQLLHAGVKAVPHRGHFYHVVADELEGFYSNRFFCPTRERQGGKIAGQPHSAGQDDLIGGPLATGRLCRLGKDFVDIHRSDYAGFGEIRLNPGNLVSNLRRLFVILLGHCLVQLGL